jgi:hypothetical protein
VAVVVVEHMVVLVELVDLELEPIFLSLQVKHTQSQLVLVELDSHLLVVDQEQVVVIQHLVQ